MISSILCPRWTAPLLLLLSTSFSSSSSALAAVVDYTLVVAHAAVDTTDPATGEPFARLGTLVNGTLPGPTLHANLGDTVVLRVINEMSTSGLTIHVHGQHQVGTYFYDGVPRVTQCDILPDNEFEYRFTAGPAGTFFYHSHEPYQMGDGIFGAFVVHDTPENDPYVNAVAGEVELGIHDWLRYYSDQVYEFTAQSRFDAWPLAYYLSLVNGKAARDDPFVYTVTPGGTYRLRLYAASVEYGHRVYLANHTLTVIAADGSLVAPQEVDFIDLYSGERYDVLVTADQPAGAYEFRIRPIDYVGVLLTNGEYGAAVFTYEGVVYNTNTTSTLVSGTAVMSYGDANNSTNTTTSQYNYTLLDPYSLTAFKDDSRNFAAGYVPLVGPQSLMQNDSLKFYKTTSYAIDGNPQFTFHDAWDFYMNQPPDQPILFHAENLAMYQGETRSATHVSFTDPNDRGPTTIGPRIESVPLGQVVDIVFQNAPTPGNENGFFGAVHPMHMHGHYYWVLGSGPGAFDPAADPQQLDRLNFQDPPMRDNVVVRPNSWTVVRLEVSNAGIWLLHCHSETHAVFGMMTIYVVGTAEERPAIPADFPTCGLGVTDETATADEPSPTAAADEAIEPTKSSTASPSVDGAAGNATESTKSPSSTNSSKSTTKSAASEAAGVWTVLAGILAVLMMTFTG